MSTSATGISPDPRMRMQNRSRWIRTWQASPAGLMDREVMSTHRFDPPVLVKGTIRTRIRLSQGGSHLRFTFSNECDDRWLTIAAATVGVVREGHHIAQNSLRRITHCGESAICIAPGSTVLTDPVQLPVSELSDLIVSTYVPDGMRIFGWSSQTSDVHPHVVEGLDATHIPQPTDGRRLAASRSGIACVDALTDPSAEVIVAFGDSLTEGLVDLSTGERGWPDILSRRLSRTGFSVVNAGIHGNRLLQGRAGLGPSGLQRLHRDALSVPGVSHVIVLHGINDIIMSGAGNRFDRSLLVSPLELIAGFRQIIARAHERSVRVFGATLLPFAGALYYSEEREQVRSAVNGWIRTSNAFDDVLDFDAAVRDPSSANKLRPSYDAGDHLHVSAAGNECLAAVVSAKLFQR